MATVDNVFHSLIGGMSTEEFNSQVRERRAAHFRAAFAPAALDGIFTVARLEHALRQDSRLTPYIDVFDGQHLRQLVDPQRRPDQTTFDVVADLLRRGATIRVRSIETFDAQLGELTSALARRLDGRLSGNVYLTPPDKAGFPPHFDLTDVFVIQCAGKKHWRIYDRYTNMLELPLAESRWDLERCKPMSPPRELELNRGDVLYLPRGVMHEAFCTNRESMHLTMSLASLTFSELFRKALASAAAADIELRRRIPWPGTSDTATSEAFVQRARELLMRVAGDADLATVLRDERPTGARSEK